MTNEQKKLTDEQKKEIQGLLDGYCNSFESQAKAANMLRNASETVVINIRRGNWQSITDEMWRNVGKQIGWSVKSTWYMVETLDFNTLIHYFADAKDYSNVFALVAPAGSGKTFAAEYYASRKNNTYHLTCAEYWNRKMFLGKLLEKMGKENTGLNVAEMMDLIVDTLIKQDTPCIILDEADKLSDQVLYFFITLYNQLKGKCGIVIMATDFLSKRIKRGLQMNKKGYAEIFSRIGRKFIQLHGSNKEEITQLCKANGITDPVVVTSIYNEYEGDLRRVERLVHKYRIMGNNQKRA